jgi:serine/threonine-protein kinase
MGIVYHAIDPNIGRPVAIKTIQLTQGRKPEDMEKMRERLFREARSAGMLSHPGIVTIYDVEQQGDLAYIAMEYVDGPTLDQLMNEPQTMAPEKMFSILAQAAVALDYAHSKGIVHRDIKPANIMVTKDGTTKITDFGIAKITASESLTMTNAIVGTPHYMSPEQVQGQAIDGRSDQFSLAVIAYEMLTGEKPYTGEHLTTVVYKIVAEEPALPHRLNPSLTSGIEGVIRKGLAKRPDSRYRSCEEFTSALEEACLAAKGWKLMPRGGVLNEPTVAEARPGQPTLPPPRRTRRSQTTATVSQKRKSGFLPFLVAVLFVAGLLAGIGWQGLPWLMPGAHQDQQRQQTEQQSAQAKAPQTQPQQTQPPSSPAMPGEEKPSPIGPPQTATPSETPSAPPQAEAKPRPDELPKRTIEEPPKPQPPKAEVPQTPARRPASLQDVMAVSSPAGATATLDSNPAASCTTPCTLQSPPGRHTVSFVLPGRQVERREVFVAGGPIEIPPVMLRTVGGTLMLSSVPSGASVSVDGKKIDMETPAQIPLALGTYSITVEKDGKTATEKVDIKGGINYRRISVGQ